MMLPDLTRYAAATHGVDYAVTLDSGRAGPHAVIMALIHGNEVAGAIGLDRVLSSISMPVAGKLTACFANHRAYELYDPAQPLAGRFLQEDMNRLWTDDLAERPANSWEASRAQALLPVIEDCDFLLDLHTMPRQAPPLALIGAEPRHRDLARAMAWPHWLLKDPGHEGGPRLTDYRHFGGGDHYASAILVECGGHQSPDSANNAEQACLRFLSALHMLDAPRADATTAPVEIEVTHTVRPESEAFRFAAEFEGLMEVAEAGTLIAHDGEREIRTPYDHCVLLMPSILPTVDSTALRFGRTETIVEAA